MIIPVQPLPKINTFTVDPQSLLLFWGSANGGDEGSPVSVFAFERYAWHFTGASQGSNINNPNVPIAADRSVTLLGSNDGVCYGPIFTLSATDPDGMNARIDDPMRVSHSDGAYMFIKPVFGGSLNPAGPDCGLLLFCTRLFGPRV